MQFTDLYRSRRVLVTGHTGFKGSWLALWLTELGARVHGISLPAGAGANHSRLLDLPVDEHLQDLRDPQIVGEIVGQIQPEVVFHLAAQPLVRRSYRDPLLTWSTNVMGTANLLEACRRTDSVRAIVVVTTDKCYANKEQIWGYRETDEIGGHDPYSASKAAAEILVNSYRQSYFSQAGAPLIASARAGNVIGGGDWSEDRLIPDLVRAITERRSLEIRSPSATRPWQHVLESLSGYLLLGQRLLECRHDFADAWNFGPGPEGNRTVSAVLESMQNHWPQLKWHRTDDSHPHETTLLQLDSTKSHRLLGWRPVWTLEQGLEKTAQWYREFVSEGQLVSRQQLDSFICDARQQQVVWT